ncbi:hypothetical protein [Pseudomonas savastanoi]|uniref:hypothetical protein n=1 Tax=Pseudomonas savastanoi TaxID=29438 RepID=UPI0001F6FD6E|nr:hypothetical protein [Pseudomonas savastanoi]EFW77614.1 hypothetical protein PsgB076_27190 [Pseudomonas savastanoi pv. glycinea str. B076]
MATQPEFLAVRHKLDSAGFNVPLDATRGELLEVLQDIRRADQQQEGFVDELRDLMESGSRRDDQLFAAWLGTVHVELVKLGNDSPEIDTEENVSWFYERFETESDAGSAANSWASRSGGL